MEVLVMRSWLGFMVMGSLGLLGCAAGSSEGAEEGGPALVMLDADARAAGFSLVTSAGRLTPVAPIELEGDITLVGPGQRIPLSGTPGELLVVTGKRGALVAHTLATEIDGDGVRVDGREKNVRALASALGAKVTGSGPWELRAPKILMALTRHPAPEGVSLLDAILTGDTTKNPHNNDTDPPSDPGDQLGGFRPFTVGDPRFASYGILGASSPVCSDPAVGTWVSVPQRYDHWHVFTLHVEPGARPDELTGTVSAHVWSGGLHDEAPNGCEGNELDVRVSMPATGSRADDGSIRFDAGAWQLDRTSCTGAGAYWGYYPDHFVGLIDGGGIRTVNNDGTRWTNAPVGFERVSCE
jgi:hypothetical protein